MANSQKVVDVPDVGVVAFPGDLPDEHVVNAIKLFRAKKKVAPLQTEESEHARQLKPAQPLDSAIPTLPKWANTPLAPILDKKVDYVDRALWPGGTANWDKLTAESEADKQRFMGKHPIAGGVFEGVNETAEGLTSPANLALMIAAPESKIMSGLFAIQALHGSYKDIEEARKAYREGRNAEASKYATQAVLNLGIAGLAGHHAVKDIPVPEGVKDFVKSEEGSVGPQGPEDAKASLKKARDEYSALKPETVEAYNKALENYKLSTKAGMRQFLEKQIGQAKTPGDLKDVDELERMYALEPKTIADVKAKAAELKPTTAYKTVDDTKPFFLKSENLITEKMKGPMPAEDVHRMLLSNGVKPEEMKWTGLDELLQVKGKQKVTPQEIQEHLAGNNLQVQEVVKGQPKPTQWTEHRDGIFTTPEGYKIERLDSNGKYVATSTSGIRQAFDTIDEAKSKVDYWRKNSSEDEVTPKFSSYQLPGAEPGSYRELLVTMPEKAAKVDLKKAADKAYEDKEWFQADIRRRTGRFLWETLAPEQQAEYRRLSDAYQQARDAYTSGGNENFRSSHWDEPNVLGHVRFNDRTGPNGEKILHVEELQSDWHQKGRSTGYSGEQPKHTTLPEGYVLHEMGSFRNPGGKQYWVVGPDGKQFTAAGFNKESAMNEAINRLNDEDRASRGKHGSPVPDAPFKKNWHELMLKRMMKYAAEHGYDGVSWTPGEEQASRYDLSKQISRVKLHERPDLPDEPKNTNKYRLTAYDLDKNMVLDDSYDSEDQLAGVIGKEAARKLIEAKSDRFGIKELSGLDLKVGGEGMRGFYDKIIPDAANKLGKQWGAKVGETKVVTETTPKKTYVGPSYTYEQLKKIADGSKGTMIEGAAKWVADSVKQGSSLEEAMDAYGSPMLAEKLGGSIDVVSKKKTVPVPYLPITPQMRAGVKSIPFSLFSIPLAAGALTLAQVKAKAQELQDKQKKTGVTQ